MAVPDALNFSSPAGRRATPDRMDAMGEHVDSRLRAVEANRQQAEAAIAELKEMGLERVNQTLLPILQQAVEDAAVLAQLRAEQETPGWRAAIVSEAKEAVLQELEDSGMFVRSQPAGLTLHSGTAPPAPGSGEEGDIYIYVAP